MPASRPAGSPRPIWPRRPTRPRGLSRKGRPRNAGDHRPVPGKEEIERRCALTHEVKPAAELIRFVVGPDDVLVPDTDARAEGRGVWISLGQKQVAEAVRRNAFAKSLK